MNTNVRALLSLVQAAMPLLERQAGRAKVIVLSSHGSQLAQPQLYGLIGSTKAAVECLVRHFARELGDRGVNFNVLRSGAVDTDSIRRIPNYERILAQRRALSMVGDRLLTVQDVADAVLFLASPLSDLVQGQTLVIDGGAAVHG
jgi:enoyl-[acyl-carrier protein] reductase III